VSGTDRSGTNQNAAFCKWIAKPYNKYNHFIFYVGNELNEYVQSIARNA
jgi:hypothetical protein